MEGERKGQESRGEGEGVGQALLSATSSGPQLGATLVALGAKRCRVRRLAALPGTSFGALHEFGAALPTPLRGLRVF